MPILSGVLKHNSFSGRTFFHESVFYGSVPTVRQMMFDFFMMLYRISGVIYLFLIGRMQTEKEFLGCTRSRFSYYSNRFCTSFPCQSTLLDIQAALMPKFISVCERNLSQSDFNHTHDRLMHIAWENQFHLYTMFVYASISYFCWHVCKI